MFQQILLFVALPHSFYEYYEIRNIAAHIFFYDMIYFKRDINIDDVKHVIDVYWNLYTLLQVSFTITGISPETYERRNVIFLVAADTKSASDTKDQNDICNTIV